MTFAKFLLMFSLIWCGTPLRAAVDPMFAQKLVRALLGQLPAKSEIELSSVHIDGAIPHRPDNVRIISPSAERGIAHFEVVWKEGNFVRTRRGTATYSARCPIAVATQAIRIGGPVNEQNSRFEIRAVAPHIASGFFTDPKALNPLVARMFITPGTVITRTNAEVPPVVTAGTMVDVWYIKNNLSLSLQVRAMQSGNVDEWIRVQHPTTRKILHARIKGPSSVVLP